MCFGGGGNSNSDDNDSGATQTAQDNNSPPSTSTPRAAMPCGPQNPNGSWDFHDQDVPSPEDVAAQTDLDPYGNGVVANPNEGVDPERLADAMRQKGWTDVSVGPDGKVHARAQRPQDGAGTGPASQGNTSGSSTAPSNSAPNPNTSAPGQGQNQGANPQPSAPPSQTGADIGSRRHGTGGQPPSSPSPDDGPGPGRPDPDRGSNSSQSAPPGQTEARSAPFPDTRSPQGEKGDDPWDHDESVKINGEKKQKGQGGHRPSQPNSAKVGVDPTNPDQVTVGGSHGRDETNSNDKKSGNNPHKRSGSVTIENGEIKSIDIGLSTPQGGINVHVEKNDDGSKSTDVSAEAGLARIGGGVTVDQEGRVVDGYAEAGAGRSLRIRGKEVAEAVAVGHIGSDYVGVRVEVDVNIPGIPEASLHWESHVGIDTRVAWGRIKEVLDQLEKMSNESPGLPPLVLDLDGNGISITQQDSSNFFFNTSDDGYQHRIAWAGIGDAVLAFDTQNDGIIDQKNEIVFTEWDPTAKSDMQALRDVFDTNRNGQLDAGDAQFAQFKVMVTNADGTISVKTLAEAGIASINLIENQVNIQETDGSVITGQNTFTRTDGSTGTAATVSFAVDENGYAVTSTLTPNGDGTTTFDQKARNADGGLANETITISNLDGSNRTIKFDNNGDGVIDRVRTNVKVTHTDKSTTETIIDKTNAGILLEQTKIETSADGKSISFSRDLLGGGWFTETETRIFGADNSTTVIRSELNPDGSLKYQNTRITSADDLSKTTDSLTATVLEDLDGDGDVDTTTVITRTVVVDGAGNRTETETLQASAGTTLVLSGTTVTTDQGRSKTTTADKDGDGDIDFVEINTLVLNGDGSTVSTLTDKNGDGSKRNQSIVSSSADNLSKTTQQDVDGNSVFERVTTNVTVVNADKSRTQTISDFASNGSLLSKLTTVKGADGRSRNIQVDSTGDGVTDQTETIVITGDGSSLDTAKTFNTDGSLIREVVTTTSADGLSITAQQNNDGVGGYDRSISDITVVDAGGVSVQNVVVYNGDGSVSSGSMTTTSADGLSSVVQFDINGDGLVDGKTADITAVNSDGSYVETVTKTSGDGSLTSRSTKTVSANRRNTAIVTDRNGDGKSDQTETLVTQGNGTVVDTVTQFSVDGGVLGVAVTTTSADKLSTTVQADLDGNGVFDAGVADVTILKADGSRVRSVTETTGTSQVAKRVTTTSANGLSKTDQADLDGDNSFDVTTTDTTVFNADGGQTSTVSVNRGSTHVLTNVSTTSDDGFHLTIQSDLDGNGTVDSTTTKSKEFNSNGSVTETTTIANASVVLSQVTQTVSADGRSTAITTLSSGAPTTKQTETIVTSANGDIVDAVSLYSTDNSLLGAVTKVTSATGLSSTLKEDQDGDGITDLTTSDKLVLNTDGSTTETITETNGDGSVRSKHETFTTDDGLSVTKRDDFDGDGIFDVATATTRTLQANGVEVLAVTQTNADGSLYSSWAQTTSRDLSTVTTVTDWNGDGQTDRIATSAVDSHGTVVETVSDFSEDQNLIARTVGKTSANGLSKSVSFDADGNGVFELTTTDVVVFNPDGSRTETFTDINADGSVRSKDVSTTSANRLSTTTTRYLNSDSSFDSKRIDSTVINTDGSTTETVWDYNFDNTTRQKAVITTAANGLSKTVQTDFNGDGLIDRTTTDVTVLNGDGSKTETITSMDGGTLRDRAVVLTSADTSTVTISRESYGPVKTKQTETISIEADGDSVDVVSNVDFDTGTLFNRVKTTTTGNGLTESTEIDQNGDGTTDFSSTDVTILNTDGSRTQTVTRRLGTNGALIDQTVTKTSGNGLSKITQIDADGLGGYESVTTKTKVFNADGSETSKFVSIAKDGYELTANETVISADQKHITVTTHVGGEKSSADETVVESDGDTVETLSSWKAHNVYLGSRITTTSADGLEKSLVYKDQNDKTVDTQTLVTKLNADSSKTETVVETNGAGVVLVNSSKTTSADGLRIDTDMSLYAAVGARLKTTDTTELLADGSTRRTMTGSKADGTVLYKGVTTQSDDGLASSSSISLDNNSSNEITVTKTIAVDGATDTKKTFKGLTGILLRTEETILSTDGRDTSILIDRDGDGDIDWAEISRKNADGSTLSRVKGNAAFNAPAFARVITTDTNTDGGTTTTIVDSDNSDVARGITTVVQSANGLSTTTSFDTNADSKEDLRRSETTALNDDGSRSARETTRYGNGLLATNIVTEFSADGRTVDQYIDNDGNGIYEQVTTQISESDGSGSITLTRNDNKTGRQDSVSTLTWTADALVTESKNLAAEAKFRDVSTAFAGSNGSYQWVRYVAGAPIATVTHMIDANGIDTWSWNISNAAAWNSSVSTPYLTASGQITIDVETRDRYIEAANAIYKTALDREMGGDEMGMLAQYITNGQLDRTALANSILTGGEFLSLHNGSVNWVQNVNFAYLNVFGRLPTTAEYNNYSSLSAANALVAIAELGRTSGQVIRSDNRDGVAIGTVSYADATAGVNINLADTGTYYNITTVIGSDYNDILYSDAKANATFIGGKGVDWLYGYGASDTASYQGSTKSVTIDLSLAYQVGSGDENGDYFYTIENVTGGAGNDTLKGYTGDNILEGGAGNDTIDGGAGNDTAAYTSAAKAVTVDLRAATQVSAGTDADGDKLTSIENLTGSDFADTLTGNDGANVLSGGLGNDVLQGFGGADKFVGGLGRDTVTYKDSDSGVTVDLDLLRRSGAKNTGGQFGDAAGDTFDSIENLTGSKFNDVLTGSAGANVLDGGSDEDGSKWQGNDQLIGGAGNDVYKFGAGSGRDEVIDNNKGEFDVGYKDVIRTLSDSYSYQTWYKYMETKNGGQWTFRTVTVGVSMDVSDFDITWTERAHGDAGLDTIALGSDITLANLAFELRGDDLYIGLKTTAGGVTRASEMKDAIRLANWTDEADRVEMLKFANGSSARIADQITGSIASVAYTIIDGSSGNDSLTGTTATEKLSGGAGNDAMTGGGGNDRLEGGAGDDTYTFKRGDGWDSVRDEDLATVTETVDSTPYEGSKFTKTYGYTYTKDKGGTGSGTATVVFSDKGPRLTVATHQVEMDAGRDTIAFGAGIAIDDLAMRLAGNDLIIGVRDASNPNAEFWALKDQMRIENWVDAKDRIETLTFANGMVLDISQMLTATSGNKQDDIMAGSAGADNISGDSGNDIISGGEGNDTLSGNNGNDVLNGGAGNDILIGGDGNDTYYIVDNSDTIVEDPNSTYTPPAGFVVVGTTDYDKDSQTDVLLWNQAAGTVQTQRVVSGVGQTPVTVVSAGWFAGWNVLGFADVNNDNVMEIIATSGANTMAVYLSGQSYSTWNWVTTPYTIQPIGPVTNPDGGIDTVISAIDYTLSANLDNLTFNGSANLTGTGNALANVMTANSGNTKFDGAAGNDTLIGGAGNDFLDGGSGNDTLTGGKGDDTYVIDSAADVVTEQANEGWDVVRTKISGLTVMTNVEALTLDDAAGAGAIANAAAVGSWLYANSLGSKLNGGAGDDRLIAGAGADTLTGAGGNDYVSYQNSSAGLKATLGLAGGSNTGDAAGDTFVTVEGLIGTSFNDELWGAAAAATYLDGGAGNDKLHGGTANDTFRIDNLGDTIDDQGGTADWVQTWINFDLSLVSGIENIAAIGGTNANVTGNNQVNTVWGDASNNVLDGGIEGTVQVDTLAGGTGNDTYILRNADTVNEVDQAGYDTVDIRFAGTAYTVAAYVEYAKIAAGVNAGTITGNAQGTYIEGNELANTLVGGTANDVLVGGAGADNLNGSTGTLDIAAYATATAGLTVNATNTALSNGDALNDVYTGIEGIRGSAFNDTLIASTTITYLDGGVGADSMTGSSASDTFVVDNVGDVVSDAAGGTADRVLASIDYTLGAGIENLTLLTAGLKGSGNSGVNSLSGSAGDDTLDGGVESTAQVDTLIGGTGNDTYILRNADTITEGAPEGTNDKVIVTFSGWTNIANIEVVQVDDSLAGATVTAYNYAPNTLIASKLGSTLIGASWDDILVGGAGNDILQGGGYNDTITGGAGNDIIAGNLGADVMDGGDGIDTLDYSADYYGVIIDLKAGTAAAVTAGTAADGDKFKNFENVTGTVYDDTLTGDDNDNVLDGVGGNDILIGGKGHDTLKGGSGSNTYVVEDTEDTIVELLGGGTDTIKTSLASYTLSANIENLTFTGNANNSGKGNELANTLTGNDSDNTLDGGDGTGTAFGAANDVLYGGKGNDTYIIRNAGDYAYEVAGEGTDTVIVNFSGWTNIVNFEILKVDDTAAGVTATGYYYADNTLYAGALGSTLIGGGYNDTLISGKGKDSLTGSGGNDIASYETAAAGVTASLQTPASNTGEALGDTYATVEGLRGSDFNDTLIGFSAAASFLDGGKGNDTLTGGSAADIYIVDSQGDVINEAAAGGTDLVQTALDGYVLTAANVENLTALGTTGLKLTGSSIANTITGNAGDDTLDGGVDSAIDTLVGGLGNDTYYVHTATDVVTEAASAGTDTVIVDVSGYTVASNVEIARINDAVAGATLTGYASAANTLIASKLGSILIGGNVNDLLQGGDGDDTLYGAAASSTAGDDNLQGGKGNDYLYAGMGADVIDGGEGIDTAGYWNSSAAVTVNLKTNVNTGGEAQGDKLSGIEIVQGSAYNDSLTGDDGSNTLYGYAGIDTLDGGKGDDVLIGGAGDDTYIVDSLTDTVTEVTGEGTDTVKIAVSGYTLGANVENLTLVGNNNGAGTGNALANIMRGDDTNNFFDGTAGAADTFYGGKGDDTFVVRSTGDYVYENDLEGNDTVQAWVNFTLADTWSTVIENLTLMGTADLNGTGNSFNNVLTGNSGKNVLTDTAGGNDVLIGGAGADTLNGGAGNDYASYETASAGLTASLANAAVNTGDALGDTYTAIENLRGSAFNDILTGLSAASSFIDGGKGNDAMTGGSANDTFQVDSAGDTVTDAGGTADWIWSTINFDLSTVSGVENIAVIGGTGANATGNSGVNTVWGDASANTLDGGVEGTAQVDTLAGGDGNDTYILRNADTVNETSTGGSNDTVEIRFAGTAHTVANYVETVRIQAGVAAGAITANGQGMMMVGNELANTLIGGALNDVIIGNAGADAMTGNGGTDFASYETATAGITASLANTALNTGDAVGDTYATIEGLKGSNYNDTLYGAAAIASFLDGGLGADKMTGGSAADTYYVDDAGDQVIEAGAGGVDIVYASLNYALTANVENLTLTGAALNGTGNDLANTITGTAGNNTLDGGVEGTAANDTLIGGKGDDTYILRNSADVVTEVTGEGNDTIEVRFASTAYTVANYVETVKIATGVAAGAITANVQGVSFTGNELANTFIGAGGNDVFDGGAGADSFTGNAGTDTVTYANATAGVSANLTTVTTGAAGDATGDSFASIENLAGSAYNDTLTGDAGDNVISGGNGIDSLTGGAGNDTLRGDAGNDILSGGLGADTYQIGRGDGTDVIQNAHTDALADTLQFGANIDESQLWFKRNGNDLEVSVIGTTDGATISGWYSNAQNQIAGIKDASGHTLAAANVEALVAAMAAFAAPPVGQTTLDIATAQALAPVLAASWQ